MFNSKRKITRNKIHPVGDYLFDKYLGLKYGTIHDQEFYNYMLVKINFSGIWSGLKSEELDILSNFMKNIKNDFNLEPKLYSKWDNIVIQLELSKTDYINIMKLPDYEKWNNDVLEKIEMFNAKKSAKKYNL